MRLFKRSASFIVSLIVALVLGVLLYKTAFAQDFYPLNVHAKNGTQMFQVEKAMTPLEREKGLMFRKELAADRGMLFVFPAEQELSFWMHNTLIPLDIIFINKDGTIHHIQEMAKPLDDTAIPSQGAVKAVLEIAGGQAAKRGLKPGDKVEASLLQEPSE